MTLAIIQLINTALSLWVNIQKDHYLSENQKLEAQYNAEINKPLAPDAQSYALNPDQYRNDAALDDIEFQLCNLSLALSAAIASKNA